MSALTFPHLDRLEPLARWVPTDPELRFPRADAVKNPNTALQTTAEDWIESYRDEPGPAMAELVNFVLRVRRSVLPPTRSSRHRRALN